MTNHTERINELLADWSHASRKADEEEQLLKQLQQRHQNAVQAQSFIQAVAEHVQAFAHKQMGRVVTRCLEAVFDDPYDFRIDFARARGKTEARLVFGRDGLELTDPANECGGGVIDVAGFALRVACLLLSLPRKRRLLVLDEPFRNLHGQEYRKRLRKMVQQLAEEFKLQMLIVTQDAGLEMGKVVEL